MVRADISEIGVTFGTGLACTEESHAQFHCITSGYDHIGWQIARVLPWWTNYVTFLASLALTVIDSPE